MRRGDLLIFINLLVRVIYLTIDNIKEFILTLKKKIKRIAGEGKNCSFIYSYYYFVCSV
jgi:hypothetical protein